MISHTQIMNAQKLFQQNVVIQISTTTCHNLCVNVAIICVLLSTYLYNSYMMKGDQNFWKVGYFI